MQKAAFLIVGGLCFGLRRDMKKFGSRLPASPSPSPFYMIKRKLMQKAALLIVVGLCFGLRRDTKKVKFYWFIMDVLVD